MPDPEVKIKVSSTEAGGNSGLGRVRDQLRDLAQSIPGVSAALGSIGTAAGAVGVALSAAGKAVKEFAQSEEAFAGLDASLARAGLLTESFRQRMADLAGELQRTTGIADEEWLNVLSRLVQFGSRPETIGMDVEAVKNLAGVVGNVTTAAELYSRALQGNFSLFSRYGITIDEVGSSHERLLKLQEELAKRGAGQLEAATSTLNGRFKSLRNEMSDLLETTGQYIVEAWGLREATSGLGSVIGWLNDLFGRTPDRLKGLANAATATTEAQDAASEAARRHAASLDQLKKSGEAANKALDDQIAKIAKIQRLQDEKANAKLAFDLAGIDLKEAEGKLTPQQGIAARAKLRDGARREEIDRAQRADADKIKAAQAAVYRSKYDEARIQFEAEKLADPALDAHAGKIAGDAASVVAGRRRLLPRSAWDASVLWDVATGGGAQELSDAAEMLAIRAGQAPARLQARRAQLAERLGVQRQITAGFLSRAGATQADLGPGMEAREQTGRLQRETALIQSEAELVRMARPDGQSGQVLNSAVTSSARAIAATNSEMVAFARDAVAQSIEARRQIQALRQSLKNADNR